MVYNILTGQGFDTSIMGSWSLAILVVAVLFFIVAFANKWLEDYAWHKGGAFIGTYVIYLLVITFTGAAKWGLVGGIVGMLIGGFVLGMFYGGDSY